MPVKPTVFLSHSSRDEISLRRLKSSLEEKTSGAVRFFLSSDGQSIPLGRNWVHQIQEALDECRLMLVFLSPHSLNSHWVYFESGYAYSRALRVVPIGILSTDLNDLAPPLSLLQGFNVRSADGLNNIIALINQEFDLKCKESFSSADYAGIFGIGTFVDAEYLGPYAPLVDELLIELDGDAIELLRIAADLMSQRALDHQGGDGELTTYGLAFVAKQNKELVIRVDPSLLHVTTPVIDEYLSQASKDGAASHVVVKLHASVRHLTEKHRAAARLYESGVRLLSDGRFGYGELVFELSRPVTVGVSGRQPTMRYANVRVEFDLTERSLSSAPIRQLLELLFEREVLFVQSSAP